jgi:hypothetical protein
MVTKLKPRPHGFPVEISSLALCEGCRCHSETSIAINLNIKIVWESSAILLAIVSSMLGLYSCP